MSQEAFVIGVVVNNEDQTPIHGANIYLKKLDIGTVSQVDGQFVLDNLPYGEFSLTISMIGFKDIKKSLELNKYLNDIGMVFMSRDTIKIEEIVVDAHREIQPKDIASNINVNGIKYNLIRLNKV